MLVPKKSNLQKSRLKPFSKRSVARTRRAANDCSTKTTATSFRPSRVALATTAHPLMSAAAVLGCFRNQRALAHVTKPKSVLGEISSAVSSGWLTGLDQPVRWFVGRVAALLRMIKPMVVVNPRVFIVIIFEKEQPLT